MSLDLRRAETPADYAAFGELCRQYVDWCRVRYAALPAFVDEVFGHQALDAELPKLAEKYGPPHGRTILAWKDGELVAGGAFRRRSETGCELKRLFVTDRARGLRLGVRITEALFDQARADGYRTMKLDTARLMTEALALYAKLGFKPVSPYLEYPPQLAGEIVFMEKDLTL